MNTENDEFEITFNIRDESDSILITDDGDNVPPMVQASMQLEQICDIADEISNASVQETSAPCSKYKNSLDNVTDQLTAIIDKVNPEMECYTGMCDEIVNLKEQISKMKISFEDEIFDIYFNYFESQEDKGTKEGVVFSQTPKNIVLSIKRKKNRNSIFSQFDGLSMSSPVLPKGNMNGSTTELIVRSVKKHKRCSIYVNNYEGLSLSRPSRASMPGGGGMGASKAGSSDSLSQTLFSIRDTITESPPEETALTFKRGGATGGAGGGGGGTGEDLAKQIQDLKSSLSEMSFKFNVENEENNLKDKRVIDMKNKYSNLLNEREKLENDFKVIKAENISLKEISDKDKKMHSELNHKLEEYSSESEKFIFKKKFFEDKVLELQNLNDELNTEVIQLQNKSKRASEQVQQSSVVANESLQSERDQLEVDLKLATSNRDALFAEIATLKRDYSELKSEVDSSGERNNENLAKLDAYEFQIKELQSSVDKSSLDIVAFKENGEKSITNERKLESDITSMSSEVVELKSVLVLKEEEISSLSIQVEDFTKSNEMEMKLKSELVEKISANEESEVKFNDQIKELIASNALLNSELEIEKNAQIQLNADLRNTRRFEEQLNTMQLEYRDLSAQFDAVNLENATLKPISEKFKILTKEFDVLLITNTGLVGDLSDKHVLLEEMSKQLEDVQEQLSHSEVMNYEKDEKEIMMKQRIDDAQDATDAKNVMITNLTNMNQELSDKLRSLKSNASLDGEQAKQQLKDAQDESDVKDAKMTDLTNTNQELSDKLSTLESNASLDGEQAKQQLKDAQDELDVKDAKMTDLTNTNQELSDKLSTLESNASLDGEQAKQQLKIAQDESDVKDAKMTDLTNTNQELSDKLSTLESNASLDGEQAKQQLKIAQDESNVKDVKITDLTSTNQELLDKLSTLESNASLEGEQAKQQLKDAQDAKDAKMTDLTNTNQELSDKLSTLESNAALEGEQTKQQNLDLMELKNSIKEFNEQLSIEKNLNGILTEDLDKLKNEKDEVELCLRRKIQESDECEETLKSELEEMSEQYLNSQLNVEKIEADGLEFKEIISRKTSENSSLKNANDAVSNDIEILRAGISSMCANHAHNNAAGATEETGSKSTDDDDGAYIVDMFDENKEANSTRDTLSEIQRTLRRYETDARDRELKVERLTEENLSLKTATDAPVKRERSEDMGAGGDSLAAELGDFSFNGADMGGGDDLYQYNGGESAKRKRKRYEDERLNASGSSVGTELQLQSDEGNQTDAVQTTSASTQHLGAKVANAGSQSEPVVDEDCSAAHDYMDRIAELAASVREKRSSCLEAIDAVTASSDVCRDDIVARVETLRADFGAHVEMLNGELSLERMKIVNMESEKVTLSDRIANLVNELDLLKISSAEYSRLIKLERDTLKDQVIINEDTLKKTTITLADIENKHIAENAMTAELRLDIQASRDEITLLKSTIEKKERLLDAEVANSTDLELEHQSSVAALKLDAASITAKLEAQVIKMNDVKIELMKLEADYKVACVNIADLKSTIDDSQRMLQEEKDVSKQMLIKYENQSVKTNETITDLTFKYDEYITEITEVKIQSQKFESDYKIACASKVELTKMNEEQLRLTECESKRSRDIADLFEEKASASDKLIADLTSKQNKYSTEILELNNKISSQDNDETILSNSIKQLNIKLDSQVYEFNALQVKSEGEIDELKCSVDNLNSLCNSKNDEMNGLKETIQLREKDEMSSSDLVTELNDKLTSQHDEFSVERETSDTKVNTLKVSVEQLTLSCKSKNEEISEFKTELDKYKEEASAIQASLDVLQVQYNANLKQIEALRCDVQKYELDVQKRELDVLGMENNRADLQTKYDEQIDEINKLNAENKEFEFKIEHLNDDADGKAKDLRDINDQLLVEIDDKLAEVRRLEVERDANIVSMDNKCERIKEELEAKITELERQVVALREERNRLAAESSPRKRLSLTKRICTENISLLSNSSCVVEPMQVDTKEIKSDQIKSPNDSIKKLRVRNPKTHRASLDSVDKSKSEVLVSHDSVDKHVESTETHEESMKDTCIVEEEEDDENISLEDLRKQTKTIAEKREKSKSGVSKIKNKKFKKKSNRKFGKISDDVLYANIKELMSPVRKERTPTPEKIRKITVPQSPLMRSMTKFSKKIIQKCTPKSKRRIKMSSPDQFSLTDDQDEFGTLPENTLINNIPEVKEIPAPKKKTRSSRRKPFDSTSDGVAKSIDMSALDSITTEKNKHKKGGEKAAPRVTRSKTKSTEDCSIQ